MTDSKLELKGKGKLLCEHWLAEWKGRKQTVSSLSVSNCLRPTSVVSQLPTVPKLYMLPLDK